MLQALASFDAETQLVTVLDSGTAAPAYRLVRRRDGVADEVVPTHPISGGVTWKPAYDGCPLLVLQAGTVTGNTFALTQESAPIPLLLDFKHLEAIGKAFDAHTRQSVKGHPVEDCLQVIIRQIEAKAALAESNPVVADALLTSTIFPK